MVTTDAGITFLKEHSSSRGTAQLVYLGYRQILEKAQGLLSSSSVGELERAVREVEFVSPVREDSNPEYLRQNLARIANYLC